MFITHFIVKQNIKNTLISQRNNAIQTKVKKKKKLYECTYNVHV